ncbi:MAG TPA: type I methionyl aminopeptidase [Candidatus Paceibacterota bacterium]|nr:type I methionyl aminopeptidase [Candidatus Paceibacterota bacterium]
MIAKTKEEREILREGGRRLAKHVRALAELAVPGITARALEERAREMVEKDGDKPAFLGHKDKRDKVGYPSALCLSVNDIIVHSPAVQNSATLQEGDVVCLDFGIWHKGLCTDHAVTVIVGRSKSKEDEKLLKGTQEALTAGIAQAKIGNTTGDIGYAVEEIADKYGFGYPRNLSGHGVGKEVHEEPHIPNFGKPGEGAPLVENMVIAIEPMMTLGSGDLFVDKDGFSYRTKDGSNTAHFEHTVLITKKGPEILTRE